MRRTKADSVNFSFRLELRRRYREISLSPVNGFAISPYAVDDWNGKFSPIEERAWWAIRCAGLPLYPQYPVGPYFIDFADPNRKLGFEIDSKRWHRDKAKDETRQRDIERMGWTLIRIPSPMVYKSREDFTDSDGKIDFKRWYLESAEGCMRSFYREPMRGEVLREGSYGS